MRCEEALWKSVVELYLKESNSDLYFTHFQVYNHLNAIGQYGDKSYSFEFYIHFSYSSSKLNPVYNGPILL